MRVQFYNYATDIETISLSLSYFYIMNLEIKTLLLIPSSKHE